MGIDEKVIASYENGFKADANGLFRILKNQLSDPLACFRELVQNSIDEGATKVVFDFHYHEKQGILAISVDDDGKGMDYEKFKRYFRMFDSTKEGLSDKIGKFGIGKISTFALNPEKVVIETGNGNQGFKAIIEKDLSGKIMKNGTKKGTNIIILKKTDEYSAVGLPRDIRGYLKESCPYSKIPILINGETIGKEIDIESENKISFKLKTKSGYGVEGVSGVVSSNCTGFLAVKGSLNLGKVEYPFVSPKYCGWRIPCLETIADSFAFNHPISRNKVDEDDAFLEVSESILRGPVTQLAEECAYKFKDEHNINRHNIRGFLLGYLNVFFDGDKNPKDIPEKALDAKLFRLASGEYKSLENICKAYKDNDAVYISQQSCNSIDLRYFRTNKIPVVYLDDHYYSTLYLLKSKFSYLIPIDTNTTIAQRGIPPNSGAEKKYLSYIGELLSDHDIFRKIKEASTIESNGLNAESMKKFFVNDVTSMRGMSCDFAYFYTLNGEPANWKISDREGNKISLNISHPYIKSMINLSSQNPELAGFYTLCEVLNDRSLFPNLTPRETEDLLISKMRGYLK